ncbi:MAG TPA: hypothetical protein VMF51_00910 [Nocardioides sp.]|jgi:hypothetical protein|uniref:hypothetical protein n=1 Tax=Nocardioides sp. TaxID=35761 RepID=UPI002C47BE3F|nr:hypothetical protein [Nocardioides sp.]HTW13651.1 hypothetical protein [Nocardioides sp.]
MSALVEHPDLLALRRRQRAGVLGRRVGWVLLPVVIASTTLHYVGEYRILTAALVTLVVLLNTVHIALSVYVFGFVRPRRTLKVFHIYFGYVLGVLIWASQTNLDREPLHTWLTVLMGLGIAVHLLLAARCAAQRRAAQHAWGRALSG